MTIETVRARFAQLRSTQQALSVITSERKPNWRADLVQLRRRVSLDVAALAKAVNEIPEAAHPTATRRTLLTGFSQLRAALAEHQASSPAVTIDVESNKHRQSVERVRAAYDHLESLIVETESHAAIAFRKTTE